MSFALQVTRQSLCPSETCLHSKSKAADLRFRLVWSPHTHKLCMDISEVIPHPSHLSCAICIHMFEFWTCYCIGTSLSVHLGDVPRPMCANEASVVCKSINPQLFDSSKWRQDLTDLSFFHNVSWSHIGKIHLVKSSIVINGLVDPRKVIPKKGDPWGGAIEPRSVVQ